MRSCKNSIGNNYSALKNNLQNSDTLISIKALNRKYFVWTQDELIMEFVPEEVFSLTE